MFLSLDAVRLGWVVRSIEEPYQDFHDPRAELKPDSITQQIENHKE
jgi:hypothetical protein